MTFCSTVAEHRYHKQDLRVRLGEWDVNHDVEFYPYVENDVEDLIIHKEFYAGTLYNDVAVIRMDKPVDFARNPHISPACLPDAYSDFTGQRCWTTGWGKDAFGDYGKYQNILKASIFLNFAIFILVALRIISLSIPAVSYTCPYLVYFITVQRASKPR